MLSLQAIVLAGSTALLLIFRLLSSPRVRLPDALRVGFGMLAIYIAVLAALWLECGPWALLGIAIAAAVASLAIQGEGLARIGDVLGRWRLPLYLLSVATLAGLVYLFVPIATFLTSPGELDIHLDHLVSINGRDAVLVVYVAATVYLLAITPRIRTLFTLVALSALVLAIVYTFGAPFGYPMMSGLTFEQIPLSASSARWRALADAALVLLVAPTVCTVLLRFGARSIVVAIVLLNVSLGVAAAVKISEDLQAGGVGGPQAGVQLSDQPLRFSPAHPNVLIVFLDRFMGSYVESILETDPELLERLSGFTWYPRTVAAGQNSIAGLHPMLGGYDYTPVEMNARHGPLRDLSVEAFSILPYNFARQGYRVNLVGPRGLGFTMAGDCSALQIQGVNCTHIPMSVVSRRATQMGYELNELAMANYADLLVLLGSMRSAPYLVKEVVYRKGPWRPYMEQSAATTFREWAQLQAFAELSQTNAQQPNLNFISSLLPHEPYYLGEDCRPRREKFAVADEEVGRRGHISLFSLQHSIGARCTLLGVADYLDFLKHAGVYDNTRIVIVSDHGIVGPIEDRSSRAIAGGTTAGRFVGSRSVLLVKERNASGALRVSETFMPNAEVPRIVCEEISGCVNPFLGNKAIAADGRDDPFYVSIVPWQFNLQKPESFVIQAQFALRGKDPFNAEGWATLE
jgi:hypothetical protein